MALFPRTLAWLLLATLVHGDRTHDTLFTRGPAFSLHPNPTFTVVSPELGRSGAFLQTQHTVDGLGLVPSLTWKPGSNQVQEYIIVAQDPDDPSPPATVHGLFYGIPGVFTGLDGEDFRNGTAPYTVTGGFRYGQTHGGHVYLAPHTHAPRAQAQGPGLHRYFFQVVALKDRVDQRRLGWPATVEQMSHAIEGKVVGWGEWIGLA